MQKITFFRNKYVMKNKITFIAIILAANICHAQIEFYSGNNFKFPVKDGKENFSLKYDSGSKLKIHGLTAIWVAQKLFTTLQALHFLNSRQCKNTATE